jgi:hypothetical protein
MNYDEAVRKLKERLYKGELGLKNYFVLRAKLQKRLYQAKKPIGQSNLAAAKTAPDLDSPGGLFDGNLPTF